MFNSADDVLSYIRDEGVQFVDVRFTDLPGTTHHFTFPVENFGPNVFSDGLMFDGSSIRGFQAIHESDMLLLPDLSTAVIDPFRQHKTLNINFFVHDPLTGEAYSRDPRNVARKAEEYLKGTGIADTVYFGPEAEFYIFDDVRFQTNRALVVLLHRLDRGRLEHRHRDRGRQPGLQAALQGRLLPGPADGPLHRPALGDGPPPDRLGHRDRDAAPRGRHRRPGRDRLPLRHRCSRPPTSCMLYKYIIKSTALEFGHTVTFMPKPIFGDNGSGMHRHQSLWKDGEPLFYDEVGYAGLSDIARYYIGGLLKHAPSLLAFTNPTVNCYHRLVPGYEAPVNLVYSQRNRSACVRIPITGSNPKAKRIEFRVPDPSCNPYFAFAAMLMAGIDGIRNKIEPPEPVDKDLYELPPEEARSVPQVPGSLPEVLDALEADHDYLLEGGVFTPDLIETWIAYKRENEIDPIRLRPHPHEFELYYDV